MVRLDYVRLAADLYDLQFPEASQRVRLRWGQDYYRTPADAEELKNQEEEGKQ